MMSLLRGLRGFSSATSSAITFETMDVFAATRFGGNPLAIVYDEQKRLSAVEMQQIAAEFGYSETTFVLPPQDEANTAWVRIFSPKEEMPFAGHPNVGTATALAWRGEIFGRAVGRSVRLEEKAGIVPLEILLDETSGKPTGAMLTAPEPFAITSAPLPADVIAACVGIDASDLCLTRHPPLVATTGLPFIVAECTSLDVLKRSRGVPSNFSHHRQAGGLLASAPPKVLLYARLDDCAAGRTSVEIRARMHRADGSEDAGTGSANCCLVGLLASLHATPATISAAITQGVEMGRPSQLTGDAERVAGSNGAAVVGAVRIGGVCTAVSRGELVGWD